MKPQVLSPHPLHLAGDDGRTAVSVYRFVVDRFLLLPLGALVALVWANLAADSYFRMSHALAFVVNGVGMTLFVALIAQDVLEAVMPEGSLHTWRRWSVPLVAAAGGIAASAGLYLASVSLAHELVLSVAWPVACAIDIAAGYYLLKLIAPRSSMVAFLVLLAAATDVFALLMTAVWQPFGEVHAGSLGLLVLAVAIAAGLRLWQHRVIWTYVLVCGPLAWMALWLAGIHPMLALLPIVPFLPRQARRDVFAEAQGDGEVHREEHEWHDVVQVILFFFGLVNAGVILRQVDTGTWAVLAAALVGRPLGILLATGLAVAVGLRLPRDLGWREVLVVALATTSGFTFALMVSVSVLPVGAVLTQIKLGALLTTVGAAVTFAVARWLHVGRTPEHR